MAASKPATETLPLESLPLSERVALTIAEAAQLVSMSERGFRDHYLADPKCPRLYAGRSVRIPRRLFERYIEQRALTDTPEFTVDYSKEAG